jgi:predicted transcriptional regulator
MDDSFKIKRTAEIVSEYVDVESDSRELNKLMREVFINRKILEMHTNEKIKNSKGIVVPNHPLIQKHNLICDTIRKKLDRLSKRDEFSELEHGIVEALMKQWRESRDELQKNNFMVEFGWTQAFEQKIREYYGRFFDQFGDLG